MKTKSLLIVIDVQKIYSNDDSDLKVEGIEKSILNINQIIKKFDENKFPIVYVKHIHKTDGSDAGRMFDFTGSEEDLGFVDGTDDVEYVETLLKVANAYEIVKTRYSAFPGTSLSEIIEKEKVNTVTIVGFMTNFCCESTARDAHDKDLFVDFIIDATGTPDLENLNQTKIKKATSETLGAGYANIFKTSEYLKNF